MRASLSTTASWCSRSQRRSEAANASSVVIDFRVDDREMCFPMVPAGASNDDIIVGPEGLRPVNDPQEAPVA